MSTAGRPPRPAVVVGAVLLVAGGVLMIVGSLLSWFDIGSETFNGFSKGGDNGTKDGPIFSVMGGLAIVFGLVQLASKKVLALGILGLVTAVLGLLGAFADLGDVMDLEDVGFVSAGPGLYVVVAGAVVALAGSIATIAKRRV
jgi:hypothetical protein